MFDEEEEQHDDILGLNKSRCNSNASQLNVDDKEKLSLTEVAPFNLGQWAVAMRTRTGKGESMTEYTEEL